MGVGIIPTPAATTLRAGRPVKLELTLNWFAHQSPAEPPADANFLSAHFVRVAHLNRRDRPNRHQPALSPPCQAKRRLAEASAHRSGRLGGRQQLRVLCKERLPPLSLVLCTARYYRAGIVIDCRIIFRQNLCPTDFKKEKGSPRRELPAPSRRSISQDAAPAPTAVESGSDCLCRRAGASAGAATGSCASFHRRPKRLLRSRGSLGVTGGREEQAARVLNSRARP